MNSVKHPLSRFFIRWFVCALGLWIAAGFLNGSIAFDGVSSIIVGGLILAILNILIKPILIIFTLPAIALTLGLFMIIINGLLVWLAAWLYPPLHITSFWSAIFAGIVIGLVNYLVSIILEDRKHSKGIRA